MGDTQIQFKKSMKKRPARVKVQDSSDEEEEDEEINMSDFQKTKQLQKLRKRTAGTNIVTLALGKKISKIEEDILDDPFKINSGGLVTGKDMKGYKTKNDAYDVGTQFYKETHIRDEDDEMRKFIEVEMEKVKGTAEMEEEEDEGPKYLSPEDAALQALPAYLTKSTFKKDQQMLSAQMLTGIPEVDLGIEVKIQNIERTERAKRDLLKKGEIGPGSGPQINTSAVHERFSNQYGSLGSDGRFEPNVFGAAALSDSARPAWADESEVRRDMIEAQQGKTASSQPDKELVGRTENMFGQSATDDLALNAFKQAEDAEKRKNRKK